MEIEHLIAFNAILLAAFLSPGPALIYVLQTALTSGRNAGITVGLGLAVTAAAWTLAAVLGLHAIFNIFPWAYEVVKTLGALYLLYLAWWIWRSADDPLRSPPRRARVHFISGVLVNLLNPKAVLFSGAVILVVFPAGITAHQGAIIVANHLLIEAALYALLCLAVSRDAVSRRYFAIRHYINRTLAALLGVFGFRLLTAQAE